MREGEVELQQAVLGTAVVVAVRAVLDIREIAWSKGPHQAVQLLGQSTGISRSELSAFHCVYVKPQYRYGKSGVFPNKCVDCGCGHNDGSAYDWRSNRITLSWSEPQFLPQSIGVQPLYQIFVRNRLPALFLNMV